MSSSDAPSSSSGASASSLSTNAAFTKLPASLAMADGCAGAGTVAGRGGAGGGRHIAAAMCIAAMSSCTASLSCLMACPLHAFSVSEITLAAAMVAVSFTRERLAGTGLGVAGVIVTIGLNVPKTKDRVHRRISAERLQTLIAFCSQLQMT
ncbi:unnamed protein product [Closterium sp. NIES-54]